jgi:hypothetical protein
MPLEIRELHIRVTVNQPEQGTAEANAVTGQASSDSGKEAVIAQCVEEVLRIIDNKEER